MPENAWQESKDTGLRHLSVGVALYAGLCSGFILVYAPAFLSLLSLFERKEGVMRICVKRHKAVKGEVNAPSTNTCLCQKWFGGPENTHFLLFLSPLSSLVACELFVSMNVINRKQLKLSKLYATLYNSLCRCLIPPLYTMFMTTTLCHIKYLVERFRWLLYAGLCCFIPM